MPVQYSKPCLPWPEIWQEVREKREIGDELKGKIDKLLKTFTKKFVASKEGGTAEDEPVVE